MLEDDLKELYSLYIGYTQSGKDPEIFIQKLNQFKINYANLQTTDALVIYFLNYT